MALLADGTSNFTLSAVSGVNFNSQYTVLFWISVSEIPLSIGRVFWLEGSGGDRDAISIQTSGGGFNVGVENNGLGTVYSPTVFNYNQWYHMAMVRSSATLQMVFVNSELIISGTNDVGTTRALPYFTAFLSDSGGFLRTAGIASNLIILQKELSVNELTIFSKTWRVYNPRGLWAHYPFLIKGDPGRYWDYSGNQRTLTPITAGTPFSDTDAPFTSWGARPQLVGRRISAAGGGEPPVVQTYRDLYVMKRVSADSKVHYKQIVKR